MPAELRMLDARLRAAGFEPGAPTSEVAAQDEGVCGRSACTRCAATRLAYRPYVQGGSGRFARRYRAFAVCRVCGHVLEF
jgi:hypothetical protein